MKMEILYFLKIDKIPPHKKIAKLGEAERRPRLEENIGCCA